MSPKAAKYRTRVNCGRVAGKVASWTGEEGWISPSVSIDHPLKNKNSGQLVIKRKDVSAGEALQPGTAVDFLVYAEVAEGGRLGAEFCRVVPAQSSAAGPGPTGPSQGKSATPKPFKAPVPKSAPVVQSPQKVLQPHLKPAVTIPKLLKPMPKKGGKPAGKPDGKGGPVPQAFPAATNDFREAEQGLKKTGLPRQSVNGMFQTGQLSVWMGRYGWIVPDKQVDHPDAPKHQGRIYLHVKDLQGADDMTVNPGARVAFKVYVDSSGLGAQECRILDNTPGGGKGGNGFNGATHSHGKAGCKGKRSWQQNDWEPEEQKEADALPPNWEQHWSEEYSVPYYWNTQTKESVWVKPEA
mmetsp:Transcript_27190/g.50927  ORF Transcript_27190/g.50927 Transcript_27190/m.50927 type:complete len:353 (+) Transcript_27190:57-1115(+)